MYLVIFGQKSLIEFLDWWRERLREKRIDSSKLRSLPESESPPPLTAPASVIEARSDGKHVRGLLEAAGYRITDTEEREDNLFFWCKATHGYRAVVYFVSGEPWARDIAALKGAVSGREKWRGILLTHHPLSQKLHNLARECRNIKCYTYHLNKVGQSSFSAG